MELHTGKVGLPFLFETFHVSLIIFVLFKIANCEKINKKSNLSENFQNKNLEATAMFITEKYSHYVHFPGIFIQNVVKLLPHFNKIGISRREL